MCWIAVTSGGNMLILLVVGMGGAKQLLDHALNNYLQKKGVIQPELKGLLCELASVDWTWSINAHLT